MYQNGLKVNTSHFSQLIMKAETLNTLQTSLNKLCYKQRTERIPSCGDKIYECLQTFMCFLWNYAVN